MKLIFDTETNGLFNCSVLSFSALLLDDNNNIMEVVDRYYYKNVNEDDNIEALKINGLTKEVIKEKRLNVSYSKHFKDDKYIKNIFDKADILIAHNIEFDIAHIKDDFKDINLEDKDMFCTMRKTQYLYDAPYYKNGEPKFPKLSEAIDYFEIDINKIKEKTKLDYHSSLFDVYCTYEIYKKLEEL